MGVVLRSGKTKQRIKAKITLEGHAARAKIFNLRNLILTVLAFVALLFCFLVATLTLFHFYD